jgi:hypothetical protein
VKVLERGCFEPTRDGVTETWRKLRNEKLRKFYYSQIFIRIIKARRMRWAGYVALMEEMRNEYKILVENLKGRDFSEELGVDVTILFSGS